MDEFETKLRLIFLPFLYITVAVVFGYTFFNWLLFIKFHAFNIDEEVINFIVPMILPAIPVFMFLMP